MDYLGVISISQFFLKEKERKSFENFTHRIFSLFLWCIWSEKTTLVPFSLPDNSLMNANGIRPMRVLTSFSES